MSEETPLRVHGVPKPKGTSWLKEVRIDAARNTVEQLRRQAEAQEYEELKARGITPEDIITKGKKDLSPFSGFEHLENDVDDFDDDEGFEEEADTEVDPRDKEVEDLKRELKAEKAKSKKAAAEAKKAAESKSDEQKPADEVSTAEGEVKPMTPANNTNQETK